VLQPSRKEHTLYVVLLIWISLLGLFTQSFSTAQFLEVRRRIIPPGHETSPANNAAVPVGREEQLLRQVMNSLGEKALVNAPLVRRRRAPEPPGRPSLDGRFL